MPRLDDFVAIEKGWLKAAWYLLRKGNFQWGWTWEWPSPRRKPALWFGCLEYDCCWSMGIHLGKLYLGWDDWPVDDDHAK